MLLSRRWAYTVAVGSAATGILLTDLVELWVNFPSLVILSVTCAFAALQGRGPAAVSVALASIAWYAKWAHHGGVEQYRLLLFIAAQVVFAYFAEKMRAALIRAETAEKEAVRLADAVERFVAVVNHDLRNPLNVIRMGVHNLCKDATPHQARVVARLDSATSRMQLLVNDLLDLARARHGGITLRPIEARLSDVVRKVLDGRSLRVRLKCQGEGTAMLDRWRAAQVVDNLVTNAIQHGVHGSAIDVIVDDDAVQLQVINRGIIPEEVLPKLFDPFRTSGKVGSVGLGLFIANEITKAHGGRVDVRCVDGTTRFTACFRPGSSSACGR